VRITKGDKVDYIGNQGIVVGTYYMLIMGKRYVDVYFENIKETVSLEENSLKKVR
jgi:hypothetical protein